MGGEIYKPRICNWQIESCQVTRIEHDVIKATPPKMACATFETIYIQSFEDD